MKTTAIEVITTASNTANTSNAILGSGMPQTKKHKVYNLCNTPIVARTMEERSQCGDNLLDALISYANNQDKITAATIKAYLTSDPLAKEYQDLFIYFLWSQNKKISDPTSDFIAFAWTFLEKTFENVDNNPFFIKLTQYGIHSHNTNYLHTRAEAWLNNGNTVTQKFTLGLVLSWSSQEPQLLTIATKAILKPRLIPNAAISKEFTNWMAHTIKPMKNDQAKGPEFNAFREAIEWRMGRLFININTPQMAPKTQVEKMFGPTIEYLKKHPDSEKCWNFIARAITHKYEFVSDEVISSVRLDDFLIDIAPEGAHPEGLTLARNALASRGFYLNK